ncbi:hypothetical protein NLJ89_g6759 [Agrocybe chaxingu]|uniref:Cytoplasmic tRNA 2-thiolation protein 2 n=1 Tax=Agrocybe chaxingu TaxID=84603 RepID=A0A9W8JY53_9AGAR|nr:hypothetical protein NLJ89_g6759 [Agrocybe chaxingu]
MSSCGNPNVDSDALMTRRQKYDGKTKVCVKCKERIGNIVIRYAVYCKTCFFPLIQTRFKKSLEPSINPVADGTRRKALKAGGSLVVAFSGGTGSTALLDLVAKIYFPVRHNGETLKGGKDHPRNADKGVWKGKPVVCYVEVCGAFPGEKDRTEEIREIVQSYPGQPFEFVVLRLENCFDPEWWSKVGEGELVSSARSLGLDMTDEELRLTEGSSSSSNDLPINRLKAYLSSLPTQTAFQSAIQILVRLLLLHTAASRKASHLLLGTSLTSLSVNLISGISQGAGFSVVEEAKEEWHPRPERGMPVRVIRPLRGIGMKECAIWDWWCGLRVAGQTRQFNGSGKHTIGALTRDFIFGLEADYPATVSTIARTCAKLSPKHGSDGNCVLCERPAQDGVQAWKSRISICSYSEASPAVSGNTRPSHLTEEEISNLTKPSVSSIPAASSLTPHLCYACHTLLTSRSSRGTSAPLPPGQAAGNISLPVWVNATLAASRSPGDDEDLTLDEDVIQTIKMSRADMKSQISEFLLPDD